MTTYYVDATGGNDSNTGTSQEQAWKTITKVNSEFTSGTFGAGDELLFKCGETWALSTTGIHPKNAVGTSENWFVIGSYGAGAKPIIDGQDNIVSGFRHNAGDGCDYVEIKDIEIRRIGSNAGNFTFGIRWRDCDNVRISNVTFTDCDNYFQSIAIQVLYLDGSLEITDCDFSDIRGEGIYFCVNADPTVQISGALVSGCTLTDTGCNGFDLKCGTRSSTFRDIYLLDCSDLEPAAFALGGRENTLQRVKVEVDAQSGNIAYGCDVGYHADQLEEEATSTEHVVRESFFKNCDGVAAVYIAGDANEILYCAFLGAASAIEINSDGLGTSDDQIIRGCHFIGSTIDDIDCDTMTQTDSDWNTYASSGAWDISGARNLSYVRSTYGWEENSRENISIEPGTSIYINDIKNVTGGGGQIWVDVTYRLYGVDQHRTSHVMRLNSNELWHEILMNLKLYISEDSDFSGRDADDRDTSIPTDGTDPEGVIADADVAALIDNELWLYYDVN